MPETPEHVGCYWCVRGHAPTWQHTPAPGEWVHLIRQKTGEMSEKITMAPCTAVKPNG